MSPATAARLCIREPRNSEYPACRMLIPEACTDSIGRIFRLAFEGSSNSIAGAVSYRDDGKALSGIHLHVVNTRRRAGIGSALLSYCLDCARTVGRERVAADTDLIKDPAAEAFLVANGFEKMGSLTVAEGDADTVRNHLALIQSKLHQREGLPKQARFVTFDEAPMEQVLRLHAEHIANIPEVPGLRRALRLDRYQESLALMIGEEVAGFILGEINGDVFRIPAWVVAPAYRHTAAGPLLRLEVCQRLDGRYERIQFEFLEHAAATAKLTKDGAYRIVRVMARFERLT